MKTATATTRVPRGAAPLLDVVPASVRRALVSGCAGSWRSAERLLGEMSARQREYLVRRVRVVSAWWAWQRHKPSGRARFKPGDPRRARLGTQVNFLARLEQSTGLVVTPRTLRRWCGFAREGGVGRFIDRRGKRLIRVGPRAAMSAKAFEEYWTLVERGESHRGAYSAVKPWAAEQGLAWPSSRTVEQRAKDHKAWDQRIRNEHLYRGVCNN